MTELTETSGVKMFFTTIWEREIKVPANKRCKLLELGDLYILERYAKYIHN